MRKMVYLFKTLIFMQNSIQQNHKALDLVIKIEADAINT